MREMPSASSMRSVGTVWTDLHSAGGLAGGGYGTLRASRAEIHECLREDEMSCVSVQRAYKDKISKRKRHVNHVNMGKQTGRSAPVKAITSELDYSPHWQSQRPPTEKVFCEMNRTAQHRITARSLDTAERHRRR